MIKCYRGEDILRCVNCGIQRHRLPKNLKVSSLAEDEKQLLANWLPMVENLEDHEICTRCAALLREGGPRRRGHAAVCAACGRSVKGKQIAAIQEDHPAYAVLSPFFYHFRGTDGDYKCCHNCVQSANRKGKVVGPRSVPYIDPCLKENPAAVAEIQRAWEEGDKEEEVPESDGPKCEHLLVLKYHKLAYTTDTCAAGCENKGDKLASLFTRQQLLIHQSLYAPVGTRVCPQHQRFSNWPEITRPPGAFTATDIVDMLFLLKRDLPVNFSDVEKMDQQIRRKWLGVSLKKFDELYEKSSLKDKSDGKLALALALASAHTGEHVKVLASVGQRPLGPIEAALKLARSTIDMDALRTALEAKNMD